MWKVTNNILKTTLTRYQDIIESLFLLSIKLSKNINKLNDIKDENYLIEIFYKHKTLDSRLLNVNRSSSDKFKPLLNKIIMLDSKLLEQEYTIYCEQNNFVNNGNYDIDTVNHPVPLVKLFKDYFYDKFFGEGWIWTDLVGKEYTRTMFKTDFKSENNLNSCPYCDIDSITISRNSWIEHFLPKGKFPYLACNPNNLMPSCTACNVSGTGKGENVLKPIANQYQTQIGDAIKFDFDGANINILQNNDESIENFIELLNLRKKYNEVNVRDSILSVLITNYNTFLKINRLDEFDKDLFLDFIQDIGREKGFYFVQKDTLEHIDKII